MSRPEKKRRVCANPNATYFKPRGIGLKDIEHIKLSLDELEAVRLCNLEGMYQDDAAQQMEISRQTLGRILSSANQKLADFIVNGKALRIDGGNVITDMELKAGPRVKHGRGRGLGCGHKHGHGEKHQHEMPEVEKNENNAEKEKK